MRQILFFLIFGIDPIIDSQKKDGIGGINILGFGPPPHSSVFMSHDGLHAISEAFFVRIRAKFCKIFTFYVMKMTKYKDIDTVFCVLVAALIKKNLETF